MRKIKYLDIVDLQDRDKQYHYTCLVYNLFTSVYKNIVFKCNSDKNKLGKTALNQLIIISGQKEKVD